MSYEEFKGELFRIIVQQEEVQGRRIRLLEKGYTTIDPQILNMICYINKIHFGREDTVVNADYILAVWGDGAVRSIMTWNVQEYFFKYQRGGWKEVLTELLKKIQHAGFSRQWLEGGEKNYNSIREKLILRPLNYVKNCSELEESIYRRWNDIALTLYGVVYDSEEEYLTIKLNRKVTDTWGIGEKELWEKAFQNTMSFMPPRIYPCSELGSNLKKEEGRFMEPDACLMERRMDDILGYRLTTVKNINGAIAVFYPGVKKRISELLGGDYYIGFTSIHEAVLQPAGSGTAQAMKDAIAEINAIFPQEEMLSNKVYRYCRESGEMEEV